MILLPSKDALSVLISHPQKSCFFTKKSFLSLYQRLGCSSSGHLKIPFVNSKLVVFNRVIGPCITRLGRACIGLMKT
jgi:hypothetical protein